MARVVIDTNVLVSAVLKEGKPRDLVLKLIEKHTVISSSQMLAELADVLSRGKLSSLSTEETDKFISIMVKKSDIVSIDSCPEVVLADPDDDVVICTAVNGKAEYIVTGDKHLLRLASFGKIKMLRVSQMLEVLTAADKRKKNRNKLVN